MTIITLFSISSQYYFIFLYNTFHRKSYKLAPFTRNRIKQRTKESIVTETSFWPLPLSKKFCINISTSTQEKESSDMGCCFHGSTAMPPMETSLPSSTVEDYAAPKNLKQQILIQIPGCKVHLMDEGEAFQLAQGHFMVIKTLEENVSLATIINVGNELQWPLTKDEPVVKLDALHYLFSLPVKDGEPLSYGVTFSEDSYGSLSFLDSFLKEHSCFSGLKLSNKNDLDWKEFAPRVEDYNHFLSKLIAGGTGQIVKGIFICSNAYTNKVFSSFFSVKILIDILF